MTGSSNGSPSLNFWIRHVAATDSTQDHLFRMARAISSPPPSGTVVVADRQSRGRGREGRTWLSPAGGLYASILIHESDLPGLGPAVRGHAPLLKLPLIAGLAVADMVCGWPGSAPAQVAIKWPNDVILVDGASRGRKLAGILCEAKEGRVVVGFGVNLVDAPLPTAAALAEIFAHTAARPARDAVLERVLAAFAARLGRTDTAAEVDARLWRKGEPALHNGAPILLQGVAESGALVAGTEKGVLEIISGEVTFPGDAGSAPTGA